MSGTVMKFGPQWIRTLTDGGGAPLQQTTTTNSSSSSSALSNSTSSTSNINNAINTNSSNSSVTNSLSNNITSITSTTTTSSAAGAANAISAAINISSNNQSKIYKLADYRYGREEMLALFDSSIEAPDDLKKFTDLYIDNARNPLSLTQMTDEESKLTQRNWNSEAVLRVSGKANAAVCVNPAVASSGQGGGVSSLLGDRQIPDRTSGTGNATTSIGTLSSSPRGPPGSLSRVPLDQRGIVSSQSSRGPAGRNLVGRSGPNSYVRSQYDEEGLEESSGGFESRFSGSSAQARQNLARTRFDPNGTVARTGLGLAAKAADSIAAAKLGQLESDPSGERRSVFERLPGKYAGLDEKGVRKDINGRSVQTGDLAWRREWASTEPRSSKFPSEDRSWRVRGAGEDWRGSTTNQSPSWYVKSEQRNIRTGVQNQDAVVLGVKRDVVRRPSCGEKLADGEDDIHARRRRESIPEWSVGDPLSGDKVGSFDAEGAFREAMREDSEHVYVSQDGKRSVFETCKNSVSGNEHDWRPENQTSSTGFKNRDINGVHDSISFNEFEKLSLIDRNSVPNHDKPENAPNESSISTANRREQNREFIVRDPLSGSKIDFQNRTSPSTSNDPKKSLESTRNSSSPQSRQQMMNQQFPAEIQQMLKKQTNHAKANQSQQQSVISNINSGNVPEDDNFAHLERAAEIMVAEWTKEEDHTESSTPGYNMMENRKQQHQHESQVIIAQNHNDCQSSNQALQQCNVDMQQALNPAFDANNQKKFVLLPFNHEDSQQWFYRDTQGVIQGPFNATEMFEWYKANYFVKELLVRRACDEIFYQLGEVIKIWDRIPFAPIPANVPYPPPLTAQTLLQFRAMTKQLELAAGLNPSQSQIPPNSFGLSHPAAVLLPLQVPTALTGSSLTGPQDQQQSGMRYILGAQQQQQTQAQVQAQQQQQQQHDQSLAQRRAQQQQGNMFDQNEMQAQLRQLLAQLKDREGFSSLNAQEQQEVLVRQYVASRNVPQRIEEQQQALQRLREQQMLFNNNRFGQVRVDQEELLRLQQREYQQRQLELQQKEEAEKQERLIMEHRMRAEEENQRIIDEHQKKQKEQKNEKQRRELEAEKERQRLSQLKQQQLAKQQEEFRQQMQTQQQRIQQQQQEKKQQQQQQQQQAERARKAQDQQRKAAWSTVGKAEQEPVSLASLQKMQEEEKDKERQRQLQQQQSILQSNQQLQMQRQMTWASAAQQPKAPAPIKTLAEIQKEEEERVAREKQKEVKVQVVVPNASVWNNAATQLNWKNQPSGAVRSKK